MPVPHSWHTLSANAGLCASIQQKTGLSRSRSQHGLLFEVGDGGLGAAVVMVGEELGAVVGEELGAVVGDSVEQSLPRLVPREAVELLFRMRSDTIRT